MTRDLTHDIDGIPRHWCHSNDSNHLARRYDIDVTVPVSGTRKSLKSLLGLSYACIRSMARSNKTTKTAPDARKDEIKAAGRRSRKASKVSARDY